MICPRCKAEPPDNAIYCFQCGKKLLATEKKQRKTKSRGNGTGSVYQLKNKKWRAVVVLGYDRDKDGKLKRIERSKSTFLTKKEALAYLPLLRAKPKAIIKDISFKQVYDTWLPTHNKARGTLDCYKSAYKYFEPLWYLKFGEIGIDDLQECLDDCPKGRRTKENMKALGSLMYKYAIPRGYVPDKLNFAQYLKINDSGEVAERTRFTDEQIEQIKAVVGTVPYASYVYCLIYTGFRLGEFLRLDVIDFDPVNKCLVGGSKTEAGINRSVTISPKIYPIVEALATGKSKGPLFCDDDGKAFNMKHFREEYFYPVIEAAGIDNPVSEETGIHKYTPHCCRHTFASLMKKVNAPDKDKLALIGHTSVEMLQHYQHPQYLELQKITDMI